MPFPIKERINTELFIYSSKGLCIKKGYKEWIKETDSKKYLTSEKRVN